MKFVEVGNKFVNLALVTRIEPVSDDGGANVYFQGIAQPTRFQKREAAQLIEALKEANKPLATVGPLGADKPAAITKK